MTLNVNLLLCRQSYVIGRYLGNVCQNVHATQIVFNLIFMVDGILQNRN